MKLVIVFSGGMDSTTLLYQLRAGGHELKALSFNYGQRHAVELEHAQRIAEQAGVPYECVELGALAGVIAGQSSQLNREVAVPEGHYTEESMKATVVPNRNMIMLSVAVAHAIALEFDAVAYGAHAGDHAIYPDCRLDFVEAMRSVISLCDWRKIELLTPYVDKNKSEICRLGAELQVPFALTWSCYKGGHAHCGRCGTCVERKEAFELAGVRDPTEYLDSEA